jgi:hypothetical protein
VRKSSPVEKPPPNWHAKALESDGYRKALALVGGAGRKASARSRGAT